jgi:DNA-directed RNA polymerase subunit alpha
MSTKLCSPLSRFTTGTVQLSATPCAACFCHPFRVQQIKGVQHEFSAANGIKEDVLDIMLNLKKLRMRVHSDEPVILKLTRKGSGEVTAAAIEKNADVEIMNPDLVIATMTDDKATLEMEITVSKGRGYLPTEEREEAPVEIGVIAIDALFSPVRSVGLKIENTRVGEITNYDKLLMTIATDGTVTPQEAVEQATKILLNHFTWIQGQLNHASLTEQIVRASGEAGKEE